MPPVAVTEFQDALSELAAKSGEAADLMLSRISGLSPADARAFITDAFPALLTPFMAAAGQLTTQWYSEQPTTPVRAGTAPFVAEAAAHAAPEQVAISGRWALGQASPVTAIKGSATRYVLNTSRDTVVVNAQREGKRWIRQAKPDACGFCRMLATRASKEFGAGQFTRRGDQKVYGYRSEGVRLLSPEEQVRRGGKYELVVIGKRGVARGSRALGSQYHDHCRCIAVMIRDGRYTPPDYVEEWTKQYDEIYEKTTDPYAISRIMDDRPNRRSAPASAKVVESAVSAAAVAATSDPLPDLRRKDDPTFDLVADLAAINPNWLKSREWNVNCTRCSLSVELRHRGYDVTAGPKPSNVNDNYNKEILARFQSSDGVVAGQQARPQVRVQDDPDQPVGMGQDAAGSRYFHILPKGRKQARKAAEDAVLAWGDGGRGYITVVWTGRRSAHIFNVENRGGKVLFYDGQDADIDASDVWNRISVNERSAEIVRVDDLDVVPDKVMQWVTSRTDEQIAGDAQRIADIKAKALAAEKAKADAEAKAAKINEAKARVRKGPLKDELDTAFANYVDDAATYDVKVSAANRDDFLAGVKAGKRPGGTDPDLYSSDPIKADAYRSGWFWYRRWKSGILYA